MMMICRACALYVVLEARHGNGDKRARDLVAIRRYDAILARGGQ